jgi:hypothetical protein
MNTTHRHRCEDCKAFFHQPKDLPITDATGFVDLIIESCPACYSENFSNNINYVDKELLKKRVEKILNHIEKMTRSLGMLGIPPTHKKSLLLIHGYLIAIEHTAYNDIVLPLAYIHSDNANQFFEEVLITIDFFNKQITE